MMFINNIVQCIKKHRLYETSVQMEQNKCGWHRFLPFWNLLVELEGKELLIRMLFSAVITPMICTPVGGDGIGRCDVDELGNGRRQGDGYTRNITVVGRRWMKRMVLEDFCFFQYRKRVLSNSYICVVQPYTIIADVFTCWKRRPKHDEALTAWTDGRREVAVFEGY